MQRGSPHQRTFSSVALRRQPGKRFYHRDRDSFIDAFNLRAICCEPCVNLHTELKTHVILENQHYFHFFNFAEGGGPLSMSQGGVRFGVGGRHLGPVCFGLGQEE